TQILGLGIVCVRIGAWYNVKALRYQGENIWNSACTGCLKCCRPIKRPWGAALREKIRVGAVWKLWASGTINLGWPVVARAELFSGASPIVVLAEMLPDKVCG